MKKGRSEAEDVAACAYFILGQFPFHSYEGIRRNSEFMTDREFNVI